MTITFVDREDGFIKQWPNWGLGIPNSGDHVLLHWGDHNESTEEYVVLHRTFDGTNPCTVYCTIEKVLIY